MESKMATKIADEHMSIAERMREIQNSEGRVTQQLLDRPSAFWCYRHGRMETEHTVYVSVTGANRIMRVCTRSNCMRPVIRYCDVCDCSGWQFDHRCPNCQSPFDVKNDY
jgi:hypothetical protein